MQRSHRTSHARIWIVLAALLPVILITAMIIRQNGPVERAARLLEAPSQNGTGTQ